MAIPRDAPSGATAVRHEPAPGPMTAEEKEQERQLEEWLVCLSPWLWEDDHEEKCTR